MSTIFALFDTETTGLTLHMDAPLNQQPKAIEFGGIITDGEKILDEIDILIYPEMRIEPIITKITGITNEDLHGRPIFKEVMDQLADFFAGANVGMAHNLSFDHKILSYELARIGETMESINFPALGVCTVQETAPVFGRPMKLEELYKLLVGEIIQTHRAVEDVKMMFEVCKKLNLFESLKAVI